MGLGPCPHKVVPCSATRASNKLGWSNKEMIGKNQQWTSDPIADFTWFTLWLFNIAMENGPFVDEFPIKTSIYKGFSMAMLNNQRVTFFTHNPPPPALCRPSASACCFSSSRSRSSVSMPSSFSWRLASAERLPAPSPPQKKKQTENGCFLVPFWSQFFFEGAI